MTKTIEDLPINLQQLIAYRKRKTIGDYLREWFVF